MRAPFGLNYAIAFLFVVKSKSPVTIGLRVCFAQANHRCQCVGEHCVASPRAGVFPQQREPLRT
jgi:hypothetical protein